MTTFNQGGRKPSGLKVAGMSYSKLEQVADDLRRMLPMLSSGGPAWRVDARRVLEYTLPRAGYHYHIADIEELEDCAGFTIPAQGLVVLRLDVYEGLEREEPFSRSTVIHELSHIVLQHDVVLHRGAAPGSHQFYEDSEWQAKALTAAIMMPVEACKAAHSALHLSVACGTSVQAAGYRLNTLIKRKVIPPLPDFGPLFGYSNAMTTGGQNMTHK